MKGSILTLLAALALSNGARLSWSDCLASATVNILVPHENCHKFYQCDDGKLITRRCPAKLVFNIEDQRCDWPHSVDCKNRGIPDTSAEEEDESGTGGGHNDPSLAPEICAAEGSDGILIAHEYCNKYYICNDGYPFAVSCPTDLFFNANIDQCDWPKNVDCGREIAPSPQPEDSNEDDNNEIVVPEPEPQPEPQPDSGEGDNNTPVGGGNGDPSQAAEICAAENSDGILVAHEYCNKFYICSEGRPVAQRCYTGLFFNPKTDQCDWPENVDCNREIALQPQPEASNEDDNNETVVPEPEPQPEPQPDSGEGDNNGPVGGGNSDPSKAAEICAAENSDGILVAHEYCNKFYICSEGRPVAQRCYTGLFFNPKTDQCDWPENVDCNREIAPQPQPEASNEDDNNETVVPEPEPQPEPQPDSGEGDNNGPVGGGNGDPSQAAEICAAENSDGILVAHEYCNKFYICSEGRPVAQRCYTGLFFNPKTDQCDWPENVDCNREIAPQPQPEASNEDDNNETVVPEPEPQPEPQPDSGEGDNNGPVGGGNGDPSQAAEICAAENSDGILVAHEYCNKFYICSEGRPVAQRCYTGLFFNPKTDQCDWPENVDCNREIAPQPQPEASNEDDNNETVVPEPEPQPEPQPDSGEGDNNGPVGGGNGDPSQAAEICAAENSDGILVAHEYCNKFYICSEGRPVAQRCYTGLFFNPKTDQCDWPENVDCNREIAPQPQPEASNEDDNNETVVPEPEPQPEPQPDSGEGDNNGPVGGGNGDPSQAAEICAAENSDGILVAHEYCNKFYICSEGRSVAQQCYTGLLFNPKTDQCDWPENVDCNREIAPQPQPAASNEDDNNETVVPEPEPQPEPQPDSGEGDNNGPVGGGNGDPSKAAEICAAENSDGILVAHEYCNKFYICSEGRPVAQRCYTGLFFNPKTDQCDWPENVDCNREIAPQPQPEASNEDDNNETVVPEPEPQPEPQPDSGEGDNNGPVGGGNGDPSQAAEICAAENSDGILVAHEYCNKFYICSEGRPVAQRCYTGLFFNPKTDQCDWPENVDCNREIAPQPQPEASNEDDNNETVVPEPEPQPEPQPDSGEGDNNGPVGGGNGDPSQAAEICAAENSDGILVAHEYCNKFYICSEGRPVAQRCYTGLFFNPKTDQCDWPENVDCNREIAPQPQPEASNEDDNNETVVPEPEPQPEPQPDSGEGDNNGPVGGGNGDPSQAAEICAAENSDGILVAHEYCNKFYICSEGRPVAQRCYTGLFFNPKTDQCDWPENVDCNREIAPQPQPEASNEDDNNETVVPEPEPQPEPQPDSGEGDNNGPVGGGNGDPSQAAEICAAENSDGILVAHEYCNKFYICSEGRPVAQRCYTGLFFNPKTDQCDWPENVDCNREIAPQPQPEASNEDDNNETVVPEPEPQPEPQPDSGEGDNNGPVGGGNGDPSQAAEICAAENSDGILVAHEYCNKFYICSEGRPVAQRCYTGLFFNPKTDQCDWPENVDCNREIAPQPQPEASNEDDNNETVVPEPEPQPEPQPDSGEGDNNGPVGGGNGDPSQAAEICAAENSDGILVAHEYCNKFYICSEGRSVAQQCYTGLLFNPKTDQCDWPENVDCNREIAPQPQPAASNEDDNNETVVPEPEPQPEPQPDSGEGDNNGPVGGGNGDPSQAAEICAAENSDGILVAHEYCNKFYICSEGRSVAQRCYTGLLFNPKTDQCDWPENVDCNREIAPQPQPEASNEDNNNETVVPEPEPQPEPQPDSGEGDNNGPVGGGNGDPSQAPEICAAADSDGILVAHEYCNKFYVCSEGRPVALRCYPGLFFNPKTDECDWPENVNCDREIAPQPQPEASVEDKSFEVVEPEPQPEPKPEPVPESQQESAEEEGNNIPIGGGNDDPTKAVEICAAADSDGILIAHEYCNKFYICNGGKPVTQRCYKGLFFNPKTDQCDWPQNVECDREIARSPKPAASQQV